MENVKGADRVSEIRRRVKVAREMFDDDEAARVYADDADLLLAELDEAREIVMQLVMVDDNRESEGEPPLRMEWEELVERARAFLQREGEG